MNIYTIDLEVFCENWKVTDDCKNQIAKFLIEEGKQSSIEKLYTDFLSRQDVNTKNTLQNALPDLNKWKKENFLTGAILKEMIKQLQENFDIVDGGHKINHYHFPYYDGNNFYPGVILNQKITLDYNILNHQKLFRYLFACMFLQTPNYEELFQYHFETTFKNDTQKFLLFLSGIEKDNKKLIKPAKSLWKQMKSNYMSKGNNEEDLFSFKNAFTKVEDYNYIVEKLSAPENGNYLSADGEWIYRKKGSVSAAVVLLETLNNRGYFKNHIDFNKETIVKFCKDWFDVEIGPNSSTLRSGNKELRSKFAALIKMK